MKFRYDGVHVLAPFRGVILLPKWMHFLQLRAVPGVLLLLPLSKAFAQNAAALDSPARFVELLELPWLHWGLLALGLFCLVLLLHVIVLRRKVAERTQHVRTSEQKLSAILDNAGALVFIKDTDCRYQYVNRQAADLMGCSVADIVGKDDTAFFDDATVQAVQANDRRVFASRERIEVEETTVAKHGGEPRVYLAVKVPLFDSQGAVMGVCGYSTDITALRRADESLRLAATIFESQEGMLIAGPDRRILRVNGALLRLTGYADGELLGQNLSQLQSGRSDATFYAEVWNAVAQNGHWAGEMWLERKGGEVYPAWVHIAQVRSAAGEITHYVSTQMDISERKAAEDEIRTLAYYDALTGLPNRRLMSDRLQRSLANSQTGGLGGALLVVDLDNFKDLNDTLGHDTGDELLRQVAERLEQCGRRSDTVARLGGDEFAMLLEGLSTDRAQAARQAEAVARTVLEMLGKVFVLDGRVHHTSCSVGIALYVDAAGSVEELLKRGDLAMYEAKAQGRNTLCFFDLRTQEAVAKRTALEADMREALVQKQFVLHYQAQVEAGGKLVGAEVLVRWRHPVRGWIYPDDFIGIAEATGLIVPLGAWILRSACVELARWAGHPDTEPLTLAVNVSARQFRHIGFVEELLTVLRETGANPARLKLELTESLLLDDAEGAIERMTQVRAHGVRFSLDDFGTGYSSLSYLKRLPLDQLKIDQSFVRDILVNANDAAIARTIVSLAHSMDLRVIAEGVETEEQRALLADFGCHTWQGYLFGRPAAVQEMLAQFSLSSNHELLFKE
ncbi:GGDEF and EAL domain-containing protein [Simplicispira suum]|uniref:sensor domain-containing protein n=1 Tax=Simplicispira suum TaxID=2109915 RepID=UPI0023526492|nr:GGDEF and EAL domain-containing protein [Simplicispira suum]